VVRPASGGLKGAAFVGVLWSLAQAWGIRIITLSHFVIIARLLEPSDLGVIAFAATIVACMSTLVDQGMTTIVEATVNHDETTLDSAWWATVVASLVVCAGIVIATPALVQWTGKGYLAALLPVLSMTIVLSATSAIQLALLKARFLHRSIAIAYLVGNAVGAATGIACAVAGLAYWALVAKALVEGALISALLVWLSPWKPHWRFDAAAWRGLLRQSRPVIGMRLLDIVNQRLDALLIGARLGASALGLYSTGQRIYQIVLEVLFSAVNQVSLPIFSRFSDQPGRAAEILLRLVSCTSLLTFPAFALMSATAVDLTTVVFGDKWRASGPVLSVFAIGGILFSVSYFNAPLLMASGRAKELFWLSVLNAIGNTIGFLLAVPFGAIAVASAFVIRGFAVYPVNLFLLREASGMSIARYGRALWPATASSTLAAVAAWACGVELAHWPVVARLLCALGVGVVVYGLAIISLFRTEALSAVSEVLGMVKAARAPRMSKNLEN